MEFVPPWQPHASLSEIGDHFRDVGHNAIKQIDRKIATNELGSENIVAANLVKALMYNYEGQPEKAYEVLRQMRGPIEQDEELSRQWLSTIIYLQGVSSLRQGENENCILCRGESSCILPLAPAALHTFPAGSRQALVHLQEYLARFPEDLEVRWLLNLAHMTLGEYPSGVESRFLIPLDHFQAPGHGIGKFRDVGSRVGVNRLNRSGGAVMEDFDGDGLLDLMVTDMGPTEQIAFYRNGGNGRFIECAPLAGLEGQLGGLNCMQADYDNDGFVDLFVPRGAWLTSPIRPSLLRNGGDGTFSDVTVTAGMSASVNSNSAAWADYDNDGWLDLFLSCERQPCLLYRNQRDGTFVEVAEQAGIRQDVGEFCKGAAWIDFDNDGYADLFLNNLAGVGRLFRNQRDGTFRDVSVAMGIDGPNNGFPCWVWDYDNDGWLDIFAATYEYQRSVADVVKGLLGQPHDGHSNKLFRNQGGRGFEDRTREARLDFVLAPMGCNFADLDNDGFLDMYLGTGAPGLNFLVPNRMFKNIAGRSFADVTAASGTGHLQKGHGVACGDWDRDGNIDIFIQMGGAAPGDRAHNILFQNPGHANHSLTLRLTGVKTNRRAIGARVKIVTAGRDQEAMTIHRHISSGSSFGANPLEQTIGLGQADSIALLEIYWPASGAIQTYENVLAGQVIAVTEFSDSYIVLGSMPVSLPSE